MRFGTRLGFIASAAVLAVGGAAWAAEAIQSVTAGTTSIIEAADAGTVTIDVVDGTLELTDVFPMAGWTASVERQTPAEIEIDFLTQGRHLRFNAEFEDGQIHTRVEERTAIRPETPVTTTTTTTATFRSGSEAAASPADQTFDVLGVGTVTLRVDGGSLVLVDAAPVDGWTVSVDEQTAVGVELDFRSPGNRIRFNGELEDGVIRPRVEVREGLASGDGSAVLTSTPTGEAGPETVDIPEVGSVTVGAKEGALTLLTVTPAGEWTVVVEQAGGTRIRVTFRRGDSEVEFEARWDDGRFRYEIDRDLEG